MYAVLLSLFLIFSLSPVEAKTPTKKKRTSAMSSTKRKKTSKKSKRATRKPRKATKKAKGATSKPRRVRQSKAPAMHPVMPKIVSGKIPLPKQTQYQPIIDQTDEYSYTVTRLSNNKVVILLEIPSFDFVPEVSASVESEIDDPTTPIFKDLKHPVITVDAPYKAINKAKITLESDYIVDVKLPLFGSFKAHDRCIHFIAEQKETKNK